MAAKVAINGFGRIGRLAFQAMVEQSFQNLLSRSGRRLLSRNTFPSDGHTHKEPLRAASAEHMMVSYRNGGITSVPLREAIGKLNVVDILIQYDTVRYNRRSILGS